MSSEYAGGDNTNAHESVYLITQTVIIFIFYKVVFMLIEFFTYYLYDHHSELLQLQPSRGLYYDCQSQSLVRDNLLYTTFETSAFS